MEEIENNIPDISAVSGLITEMVVEYAPKLILAVIALFIGFKLSSYVKKMFLKALEKRDFDPTLRPFLSNLIGWLMKILVLLSVAGIVGIETTSFIAVLGAAGLAVGLSLQGTLANFAGGILLLILKPFRVGDVVDTGSFMGTVEEIQIFYTKIATFQNRLVIIPNAQLSNGSITNYSAKNVARCDMVFGIGYGSDLKRAKEILVELIEEDERCLKDPAPLVAVGALGDSSVDILCRPWCTTDDYWPLNRAFQEKVKLRFDKEGIEIPFPQRSVHMNTK